MPNCRHTSLMPSPSSRRATKRRRSSITEHALHGINTSRQMAKSVTHVSGTTCHLSLRSENQGLSVPSPPPTLAYHALNGILGQVGQNFTLNNVLIYFGFDPSGIAF